MVLMEQTDVGPSAASTAGRLVLVERRAARAGVMPPLHAHPEDMQYEVIEGELTFHFCNGAVAARTGDVLNVPAGTRHTFRVESAGARWLITTRVASTGRFEDFGLALAEPVDEWPSPEERASVEAIAAANGIVVLGPPGRLPK